MSISADLLSYIRDAFEYTAAASTLVTILVALVASFLSFRTNSASQDEVQKLIKDAGSVEKSDQAVAVEPFEITALARYYKQALSRANVSFWFSIVFASIGFGVIIFAFISHSAQDLAGTAVKVASGAIIDGISALFFVQSTNAQKSMSEFFEKLRLDRLNAEARDMISEIENVQMRDQLRSQLILKYSGIDKLLSGA